MDQLIFEYHILRQVIFEVMEEEAPLSVIEREIIICAIEQAVNDAATEFNETLSAVQETFTHSLAHDLRGPISAVNLAAHLLLKNPKDTVRCVNIAGRILKSMDRLDQMIHNLLDAGRLHAGESLVLPMAECDLDLILTEIAEDTNFVRGDRIHWVSSGPIVGNWNESGLRRVFENLINNALKYSEIESVINLSLSKTKKGIEISIQNSGKLIPQNELPILFEQYRRVRSTSDNKTGWGLGLSVVKGITEAHDGHVDVISDIEHGTVFTIHLPYN